MEPFGIVLTFAAIASGLAILREIAESRDDERSGSARIRARSRFRQGQYREHRRDQANDA